MKYDAKCYELAEHFLPNGTKEAREELAELFQWFGHLHANYGVIASVPSQERKPVTVEANHPLLRRLS